MLMVVEIRLNCEWSCSKGVRDIEEDKEMKELYKKTKLTVSKPWWCPHYILCTSCWSLPNLWAGKHACGLTVQWSLPTYIPMLGVVVQANYKLLASKISSMPTHISQRERTLQPSAALWSTPLKCSRPSSSYDSSHSRIIQSYSLMAACDMLIDVLAMAI